MTFEAKHLRKGKGRRFGRGALAPLKRPTPSPKSYAPQIAVGLRSLGFQGGAATPWPRVNTPPAEWVPHKIFNFVGFILGESKRGEASLTKNLPPLP